MAKKSEMGLKPIMLEDGSLDKIILHRGTPTEAAADSKLVLGEWTAPDFDTYPVAIQIRLQAYGLAKLLMDRASQVDMGPDKLASFRETSVQLMGGKWKGETTRGPVQVPIWIEAIARVKKATVAQIQASVKDYTDEQKDAIRANERVAAMMAEIEAERKGAEAVPLDDLLG